MEFIYSIGEWGYNLYYSIYEILMLTYEDLAAISAVDGVVTFARVYNPITDSIFVLSVNEHIWAILQPLVVLGLSPVITVGSSTPLWITLCICIPFYVVIGYVAKWIISAFLG